MLFIEESSPPPFYQAQLSVEKRRQLDKWFIGTRSQTYYLNRFAKFDAQGYLSPKWHWAAFFATFGWLLYRKRYLDSIVYTVAGWSFIQLNIVIALVSAEFLFVEQLPLAYQLPIRLGIGTAIWIFWAVMVARWTDAYYYRMARREIADVLVAYPNDAAQQQAHLQREGGVSQVGLGIAFALFLFALMVIQVQFLPLYADPKADNIIQEVYEATRVSTNQLEGIYQQQGYCALNQRLDPDANTPYATLSVVTEAAAIGTQHSACIVVARLHDVPFPNRNLNGQTIVMYRPAALGYTRWHCQTSLNKKQQPRGCTLAETD